MAIQYLISVPRFLWQPRSMASWWYLYSPKKQLDAVILEVNTPSNEKANILFRVQRNDSKTANQSVEQNGNQVGRYHPSPLSSHFYSGVFDKPIFASPFERVEDSVSNRFIDPLQVLDWGMNASISNTTTIGPLGECRVTTRVSCDGLPLDAFQVTAAQLGRLLVQRTLCILSTTPRMILQVIRLEYISRLMKRLPKPTIRKGSISRNPSQMER